jgi:hypothetical protein
MPKMPKMPKVPKIIACHWSLAAGLWLLVSGLWLLVAGRWFPIAGSTLATGDGRHRGRSYDAVIDQLDVQGGVFASRTSSATVPPKMVQSRKGFCPPAFLLS